MRVIIVVVNVGESACVSSSAPTVRDAGHGHSSRVHPPISTRKSVIDHAHTVALVQGTRHVDFPVTFEPPASLILQHHVAHGRDSLGLNRVLEARAGPAVGEDNHRKQIVALPALKSVERGRGNGGISEQNASVSHPHAYFPSVLNIIPPVRRRRPVSDRMVGRSIRYSRWVRINGQVAVCNIPQDPKNMYGQPHFYF